VSKGIGECERRAEAVRSMGEEDGGEGPKVTRGLRAMEVVIGRRDGTARKEPGSRGVAEEGCDGTGNALIVPLGRAKDTLKGRSDGDTASGATTGSVALIPRGR
jgi:hypothetical protein